MSTCSPICGSSARITEAAAPKRSMSKVAAVSPLSPGKPVHPASASGWRARMKGSGSRFRMIQAGWVVSWNRLISEMPCVTSGITATEEST